MLKCSIRALETCSNGTVDLWIQMILFLHLLKEYIFFARAARAAGAHHFFVGVLGIFAFIDALQ